MAAKAPAAKTKIEITPPNFGILPIRIEGISPLMIHNFSEKARKQIEETQTAKDKVKKKREPKDYVAEFNGARYISTAGWDGVNAAALRNAMIGACRMIDGLPMTRAKGLIFIIAQGRDKEGTALVQILGNKAVHDKRPVRLSDGGTDMRNRPRYDNWACEFEIQFDADAISATDIANLLARAGSQGGIGELRPSAPKSMGGDFGMFRVTDQKPKTKSRGGK